MILRIQLAGLSSDYRKSKKIQNVFDELAACRQRLGLPPAGSETDRSTIAKLEIADRSFLASTLAAIPIADK